MTVVLLCFGAWLALVIPVGLLCAAGMARGGRYDAERLQRSAEC